MAKGVIVGNKVISETGEPFIIAEAGVNCYEIARELGVSPLEAAERMIVEAARAGADAIKFQSYKADKLVIRDSPAYWDTSKEPTTSQFELFSKYDGFDESDYRTLADCAANNGIIFMSTPFDHDAVDFLDALVPAFKIASADITNMPLIRHVAAKNKPVFLSTGAATLEEIKEAVSVVTSQGNSQIAILHCVLNYPTQYERANLLVIERLRRMFPDFLVGYSDHTLPDAGMLVLTAAYVLGARVLEKHFTLNKSLPGNDHYHAMDPSDLRTAIRNLGFIREVLGSGEKHVANEMPAIVHARRSIVARASIPKGTRIEASHIICKRPGLGISPRLRDLVIGRVTKRDLQPDEVISWEDLE